MSACFECGAPADHDHHVVPRSLGGTKTVPLCGVCHGAVHGNSGILHANALTKAALAAKKRRGERTGGVPYGSRLSERTAPDPKTGAPRRLWLEPDPQEQVVVARARDLRGSGLSLRAVSDELLRAGKTNRTGKPFDPSQIARMLRASA